MKKLSLAAVAATAALSLAGTASAQIVGVATTTGGATAVAEECPNARLHRDLEHIKRDLRKQSGKFSDKEFVGETVDLTTFSAFLPNTPQFAAPWLSFLRRLEDVDDWDEDAAAGYLQDFILEFPTPVQGRVLAKWQSGTGFVPKGFTTYSEVALESAWRCLKHLMPKGYRH